MEQITGITLKSLYISGFRNHKTPLTVNFGNITCISGHNGVGKTTIAHAVTFALYGVNFYGEQKIEHLRNRDSNICDVQLTFADQIGNLHALQRRRTGAKTELFFDNYTIRQEDINRFICDRETFLCLFNPNYLTECAGDKGRELILKNLKSISAKQVLETMSDIFRKPLEALDITDPSEMLTSYRAAIRKSEEQQKILIAKMQTLSGTAEENEKKCKKLAEQIEVSAATVSILKEKQFEGLDTEDFKIRRELLAKKLSESPTNSSAAKIAALEERLSAVRNREYSSKFSQPLLQLNAQLNVLSEKYNQLKQRISALAVGSVCPTCLMRITKENISQIKDNLTSEINKVITDAKGLTATRAEILETDRKAKETFNLFRKNDIDSISAELDELHRNQTDEVTPDIIGKEITEIDRLLLQGLLSDEDFADLQTEEKQLSEYEIQLKKLREYTVEDETARLKEQLLAFQSDCKTYTDIVASLKEYVAKRTELAMYTLKMPHTKIVLYETIKSTGELKNIFRFDYNECPYYSLSLSEKVLAGLEITALLRRITGFDFPVFIDNTESIAVFDPTSLPEQVIMLRMIKNKPLNVQISGSASKKETLPKAG